jgi:hypothetical protein
LQKKACLPRVTYGGTCTVGKDYMCQKNSTNNVLSGLGCSGGICVCTTAVNIFKIIYQNKNLMSYYL